MTKKLNVIMAAGGTGGHMLPAKALARELKDRGHGVALVTDERGAKIPDVADGMPTHILPAGRLGGGLFGTIRGLMSVAAGRRQARILFRAFEPDVVVGFGGYPAFPSLMAANGMRIPTIIHEQNAVLGRANMVLARKASAIATAYREIDRLKPTYRDKVMLVGNPVRDEVVRLGEMPFPDFDEVAPLKILITGGSQGAQILGEVVPAGLGMLSPSVRHRLQIVQQCRADDIEEVRKRYAEQGIPAELSTYIYDMPAKIGEAHLIIARAGASTIAELTVAGRPAILIPLPSAIHDHQTANAREMAKVGGARMIPQVEFTPEVLAEQIEALAEDPEGLSNAAQRALSVGRPHAAHDLADLVERVGGGLAPLEVGPAKPQPVAAPSTGVPA